MEIGMPDISLAALNAMLTTPATDGCADPAVTDYIHLADEAGATALVKKTLIREYVARNPSSCSDLLAFFDVLNGHHSTGVQRVHDLVKMADAQSDVINAVARWNTSNKHMLIDAVKHSNSTDETLTQALANAAIDKDVLVAIGESSKATALLLDQVAGNPAAADVDVFKAISGNDNANVAVFNRILDVSVLDEDILEAIAFHDNVNADVLNRISDHPLAAQDRVLRAVVESDKVSPELLTKIAQDVNAETDTLKEIAAKTTEITDLSLLADHANGGTAMSAELEAAFIRLSPAVVAGREEALKALNSTVSSSTMTFEQKAAAYSAVLHVGDGPLTTEEKAVVDADEGVKAVVNTARMAAKNY